MPQPSQLLPNVVLDRAPIRNKPTLPSLVGVKDSITTHLLKVVFSFYIFFTVAVTLIHLSAEFFNARDNVEHELAVIGQSFTPGLSNALWDYNQIQLQLTFEGMVEFPIVQGVKLTDEQGKFVGANGIIINKQGEIIDSSKGMEHSISQYSGLFHHSFLIEHISNGKSSIVGEVTIYSSIGVVFDKVKLGFLFIVVNAIIKTIALWVLFLVISRRLLSRPLASLADAAANINLDRLDNLKVAIAKRGRSELNILEDAFNTMIANLQVAKLDIYNKNNQIETHNQALSTMSEELTISNRALTSMAEGLEHMVNERTAELSRAFKKLDEQHKALRLAQQHLILQEKMASLGTLTAGVAHEINNPNNFVHVSSENLEVDLSRFQQFLFELAGADADQAILDSFNQQFSPLYDHLKTIKNGTERIKMIVEDLKTFTQLDAAERKFESVTDLLQSTVNLAQAQYADVADFVTHFAAIPELECYPAQLNQVFMNVIVNACDAIAASHQNIAKGQITIGCQQLDKTIEISIKDNGCGICDKDKSKLFEPFYTTKTVGKGTGLGLSISFGIIQRHGGELNVESECDVGSTFTISLPMNMEKPKQQPFGIID